nr:hypothetical protein [Tanacetum cinerariifolium]
MTHKLDDMIEFPESQPKKTYKEDLECEMVRVKISRCMSWLCSTNAYDEPIGSLGLGDKRGPEPPIKLHSPDSFRMKEVDHLIIHTPPSSHVASFYPKDVYFYYHPCIDDPKKHYGFKPGTSLALPMWSTLRITLTYRLSTLSSSMS